MEPWEVEVFERIKSADEDQSGTINVKELFGVIKGAAEADRQKRLFRRLFIATVVLLLIMLAANMALTAAVVFLAKDTVTNSTGVTMTPSGTRSRLPFQQRSPASGNNISCASTALVPRAGQPIRPGANSVGAKPKTARARRLHDFHGRMLISVADLKADHCNAVMAAVETSGENKGNAQLDSNDGGKDFVTGKIENTKEQGNVKVVTVVSEKGDTVEVHDCGTAYTAVNRERLRKLAVDEARNSRRRLAIGIDNDRKPIEAGCLVYHCFEGDADCANPSSREACSEWDEAKAVCLEPLCAYVIE